MLDSELKRLDNKRVSEIRQAYYENDFKTLMNLLEIADLELGGDGTSECMKLHLECCAIQESVKKLNQIGEYL